MPLLNGVRTLQSIANISDCDLALVIQCVQCMVAGGMAVMIDVSLIIE